MLLLPPLFITISLVGLTVCFAAVLVVRRYVLLHHIPGPRLAGWTDLWLFYKSQTVTDTNQMHVDLHRKYGSVVRYGPRRVMFSNVAAVPIIYGTTNSFEKVSLSKKRRLYAVLTGIGTFIRCSHGQSQRQASASVCGHKRREDSLGCETTDISRIQCQCYVRFRASYGRHD